MTGSWRQLNSALSVLTAGSKVMNYFRLLFQPQYTAFILCVLFSSTALASLPADKAIQFALCSANVESIILTKVPGNETKWEFVITLNSVGTQQFTQLEGMRPGQLVDVVWAGVSFGKRRLNLPIQSGSRKLRLGSKWFNYRTAQKNFNLLNQKLLHKRDLSSPCGVE